MRVRLVALAVIYGAAYFWMTSRGLHAAFSMLITLAGGLLLALAINVFLLNTVFFRLTKEQVEIDARAGRVA